MDIFDQFLIRGVKIIFWKGLSLVMEERQLLGEVMLKYPLLFSLLPESSRDDTMEFLKKKMLELGVQKIEELNCFRVMNGHLYWEMVQPIPITDFELALEEFLFRERLESAVNSLADRTQTKTESDISYSADNLQDVVVSPITMATEHFQSTNNLRDDINQYRDIPEGLLSRTIHCNHSNAETLKEDEGSTEGYFVGLEVNGSGKGFQDFKVEKHFHYNDFQSEHRAIKFPPVKENSSCTEIGEHIRNDFNNRNFSSMYNHFNCSRETSSYRNGNQQFYVRNGPIFLNEKQNVNAFQF